MFSSSRLQKIQPKKTHCPRSATTAISQAFF
jgi:hypothetical protein